MPLLRTLTATTALFAASHLPAQSALSADPAPNKAFPAAMESFQLPSHGALLNALVYVAAGPGPHPAVILLHGFPGNEKNLDLAQSLRRSGFDVLYFDYRGSWGSPGDFSFTHSIEDTQAALDYLRDPANAKLFRADPHQIILAGHSMGGMIAAYTAAHNDRNSDIRATILISAAPMADRAKLPSGIPAADLPAARQKLVAALAPHLAAEGMAPLAGCTPESLAQNLIDHPEYALAAQAPRLAAMPLLVITSDDGLAPANDALVSAIQSAQPAGVDKLTALHIPTRPQLLRLPHPPHPDHPGLPLHPLTSTPQLSHHTHVTTRRTQTPHHPFHAPKPHSIHPATTPTPPKSSTTTVTSNPQKPHRSQNLKLPRNEGHLLKTPLWVEMEAFAPHDFVHLKV